ncbi:MAG: 2-haloacid dehalogenase [Frankiaceae bacterium]|nr:2-haloacid dehalogenase [Frankiaceae bacterium]
MIRVLFFDVFGTVVDWRSGILDAFTDAARRSGSDAYRTIDRDTQRDVDWAAVTDDWRRAYPGAMLAARREPQWQNLDTLQARTLSDVLDRHGVTLPADEHALLVRAWRELPPWPDSRSGLAALRNRFTTATLSNGHVALLVDLLRFGDLRFDAVLSAELAQSYKPDPVVYERAAALLECPVEEAALVAAHPSDLAAASAVGMRTVFVRRQDEWGPGTGAPEAPDLPGLVTVDTLGEVAAALA